MDWFNLEDSVREVEFEEEVEVLWSGMVEPVAEVVMACEGTHVAGRSC